MIILTVIQLILCCALFTLMVKIAGGNSALPLRSQSDSRKEAAHAYRTGHDALLCTRTGVQGEQAGLWQTVSAEQADLRKGILT